LVNNRPGLKIVYFNTRSIIHKLEKIKIFSAIISPDIICITESWINPNISHIELQISGYVHYLSDRAEGSRGGGVIVYVSVKLNITKDRLEPNNSYEYVLLKLQYESAKPIHLLCVYNSPQNVTHC